ncbi:DUF2089 family protein [Dehalogenimonas formicexedens]|nr:DUF2089 family protein [Dehalogenimonas formicexedens]
MIRDWSELTGLTNGSPITVERVKIADSNIAIEGEFALPPLAQLGREDQVFIMAFVGAHGSMKEVGRLFGISYPTVKNRLVKVASKLRMVEINSKLTAMSEQESLLDMLEQGKINADEALKRLA